MASDTVEQLREAWHGARDGETGHALGEALEAEGRGAEARAVYQEMVDQGFLVGFYDLAWLAHAEGDFAQARELLRRYLAADDEPDEQSALVSGILGHWTWDDSGDPSVEPLLRTGAESYPEARVDLASLLRRTGREAEAEAILRAGAERDEVDCFIVLGNLLWESGRSAEAEDAYRQGYSLGDTFSAYNLHLLLAELERHEEAREWLELAARGGDQKAIAWLAQQD
jgi:tetratricopeptide (TPR) repeat protein